MSQESRFASSTVITRGGIELLLLALFTLSVLLAQSTMQGVYSTVFSGAISLGQGVVSALRFFSGVWALTVLIGIVQQFRKEKIQRASFFSLVQIILLVTGSGVIGAFAGAIFLVIYATPPVDCSRCVSHLVTYALFCGVPFLVLTARHFLLTERLRQLAG